MGEKGLLLFPAFIAWDEMVSFRWVDTRYVDIQLKPGRWFRRNH